MPNRLFQLLLIATTVLIYSVLGMAIGNSLFISHVGAEHLPLAFILIGLCSMPAYVLFSQMVDGYSRSQLFRYVLLGSIVIALWLHLLLTQESLSPYIYYVLLITIFFQWDFHNNVLYPSLLTDYFTTLEYKRYAPYIGIAQAIGTLIGGGLTTWLSHYFKTQDLLLCMPILFALGVIQLIYLENSQRPLSISRVEKSVGVLESLQAVPELIKRYPLMLFLASSSFLLVIVYISSEFLWFKIYGDRFSDEALTSFLGLMRIVISVVQLVVIYGVTRPLLRILGVAKMNSVYPLTTLMSLSGLLTQFGLPAAIGLHINGDAIYKAINLPVHQLNYNAIPREFIGRIRVLSDGIIYAVGLTCAGVFLWIGETHLSLIQISWLVAGLTGMLLMVRIPMGRFYTSGLEEMIRSNTINLDEFDTYSIALPPQSGEAVRELLTDSNLYTQLKGLELAARMNQPSQFLPEVEALIQTADSQVYRGAITLFKDCPDLLDHFESRLNDPTLRAFALEILLINHYIPRQDQIDSWLVSPEIELQILGAMAQVIIDPSSVLAWSGELNGATARIITRVIIYSDIPALIPLIPQVVLTQSSADIIRAGLDALIPLTESGNEDIAAIAHDKLEHPDSMVRMAAFDLLRITCCDSQLEAVSNGLEDPDPRVCQRAISALAAYGRKGLALAKGRLQDPQPRVIDNAITAIGLVKTKHASNILFDYLTPSYKQLSQTRKWQQQLPMDAPGWQMLRVAITDYHERLIQRVLFVLSALGHARTVNSVRRLLVTRNQNELENAIEVLASLNHRRFVLPLIPLLEERVVIAEAIKPVHVTPQWVRTKGYRLLLEALESKDRWIRAGALIVLSMVPSAHVNDPDPFVRQIASQIFGVIDQPTLPMNTVMNRLLFLKSVVLFKNLSLDELLLIDKSLEQTKYLAGDTIFTEGDWGTHFYIIADGIVQLIKDIDDIPRELGQLGQGQYFGEVALFDDAPRWDSAIAIEDCTLLKLEKNRFLSLITQRPHIILEICRFLSQRLREVDKHRSEKTLADSVGFTKSIESLVAKTFPKGHQDS